VPGGRLSTRRPMRTPFAFGDANRKAATLPPRSEGVQLIMLDTAWTLAVSAIRRATPTLVGVPKIAGADFWRRALSGGSAGRTTCRGVGARPTGRSLKGLTSVAASSGDCTLDSISTGAALAGGLGSAVLTAVSVPDTAADGTDPPPLPDPPHAVSRTDNMTVLKLIPTLARIPCLPGRYVLTRNCPVRQGLSLKFAVRLLCK
jgi:hypothetical protein